MVETAHLLLTHLRASAVSARLLAWLLAIGAILAAGEWRW